MSSVLLVGKGPPDRGGIPTFIATLLDSALATEHRLEFLNVAHTSIPEGGRFTAGNVRRTLHDLLAVFRRSAEHDVVHIHSALAPTSTLLRATALAAAARSRGAFVIVHVHGGGIVSWLERRSHRVAAAVLLRSADRVVTVWSAGTTALEPLISARRLVHIPNGVALDVGPPVDDGRRRPRILFVGLMTQRKGVLDLERASQLLRGRGIDHDLWLVGGTPDEGPDAEAAVRAEIGRRATLLGTRERSEMTEVYRRADLFCLPSWWEAMPLTVLEAMASGLPVVATDVGDVSRAVLPGRTGHLVAPRSPQLLADALEPLLRDPVTRSRMGTAAREHVQREFSLRATIEWVSELYRIPLRRDGVRRSGIREPGS